MVLHNLYVGNASQNLTIFSLLGTSRRDVFIFVINLNKYIIVFFYPALDKNPHVVTVFVHGMFTDRGGTVIGGDACIHTSIPTFIQPRT